jgi:HAD-superfamily hydrolase (TIGR02245 family)
MGQCYGVEKFRSVSAVDGEPLFESLPDDGMFYSPSAIAISHAATAHIAAALDGAEKVKNRKRHETDHKKGCDKKRRNKDKSAKDKDKNNKHKDKHKFKADMKSPEAYLQDRLKLDVRILHEPTPGKKCLVLDIDYTIFDHKSDFELAQEFKRPYLHEFLKVCYVYYDIVIWSATAMCHIQTKMEKLGLLNHPDFKISIVLSKEFMIPHPFPGKRKMHVLDVKPLAVIWRKFDFVYNDTNTIHIDDVVENFALNTQNGLRIDPFRDALQSRQTDRELFYLTQYLLLIGHLPTLEGLDHTKWKDYIINKLFEAQNVYSLPKFMAPPPPSTSLLLHHQTVLVARSETATLREKERRKTQASKNNLPVDIVHLEVEEHIPQKALSPWGSELTALVQLS